MPGRTQAVIDFFLGLALCNLAFVAEGASGGGRAFLLATGALLIALAFIQIRTNGRRPRI
jgi:hypothetical protein